MNIAVFCSGKGTNLQAIIDAQRSGKLKANIAVVVSDTPDAYALVRAKKAGIKTLVVERKNYKTKKDFEEKIIHQLQKEHIDLICLAGYMRILSRSFIQRYKNKILNIHPALLPCFKGTSGVKDALDYGVKVTGPTVHFVDEEMDHGPIILQRPVEVKDDDTEETLAQRIHQQEHTIYPEAIRLFVENKLKIEKRCVRILQYILAFFICSLSITVASALTTEDVILSITKQPAQEIITKLQEIPKLGFDNFDAIQPINSKEIHDNIISIKEVQQSSSIKTFKSNPSALDSYFKNLTNPCEGYSKEDIQEKKIKFAKEIIDNATEVAETLNLKPLSNIIGVGKKIIETNQTLKKKYNLHIKVDKDKAFLSYRKKF